jgi:hypothetical protein
MLANTITCPSAVFLKETDGDDTTTQLVLTRLEETVNRSTYGETTTHAGGQLHSVTARNQVQFYRTYPKRTGSSRGAAKLTMKWTRDVTVANADGSGDIVLPLIGEVSFSIPVGANHWEISNLRRRIASLLTDAATTATEAASVGQLLTEGLQI